MNTLYKSNVMKNKRFRRKLCLELSEHNKELPSYQIPYFMNIETDNIVEDKYNTSSIKKWYSKISFKTAIIILIILVALIGIIGGALGASLLYSNTINELTAKYTDELKVLADQSDEQAKQIKELKADQDDLINRNSNLLQDNQRLLVEVNKLKEELIKAPIRKLTSRGGRAISREYNLRSESHVLASELNQALASTKMAGLGYAAIKAEKETGVNAIYILSKAAWESGWGNSAIGNNLVGAKAPSGWKGKTRKALSAEYDKAGNKYYKLSVFKDYDSKEECIMDIARDIAKNYLSEDGAHFNGYTLAAVNISYATDKNWSIGVANTMRTLAKRIEKIRQVN